MTEMEDIYLQKSLFNCVCPQDCHQFSFYWGAIISGTKHELIFPRCCVTKRPKLMSAQRKIMDFSFFYCFIYHNQKKIPSLPNVRNRPNTAASQSRNSKSKELTINRIKK